MGELLYQMTIEVAATLADAASGWLFQAGVEGIEERQAGDRTELVVYSPDQTALEVLARRAQRELAAFGTKGADVAPVRVSVQRLESLTWQTEWTRHLQPEPIGESFVIQPVWDRSPPPSGRRVIYLQPRLAFGVGSHATTRLVAGSVERFCRAHPGCQVLDVGTGTGVLAMVALLSGASQVRAIDTDPVAVDAAQGNLDLNRLHERCQISNVALPGVADEFDLVVANLESPILIELGAEFARVTRRSGKLAVSGVMTDRADEVAAALFAHRLRVVNCEKLRDWVLLELVRS